ncbi:hypothetical protein F4778DRAFT_782572 [Xylariomycetidae sp. FL2044]|nr:hypothetical protein F4778DRAFT_782572 [Xylariomycetidae sp. FL2044]
MKSAFAVVIATFAAIAAAAPLNINLGAYSPALVVGDGAIGFTGEEGEAASEAAALTANALQGESIVDNRRLDNELPVDFIYTDIDKSLMRASAANDIDLDRPSANQGTKRALHALKRVIYFLGVRDLEWGIGSELGD